MITMSADQAWRHAVAEVLQAGERVAPAGRGTLELLGHTIKADMARPVVTTPARKIGRRFMLAEAAWILSGSNSVEAIARYNASMRKFSDDGVRLFGAYGPKVVDQLSGAVAALREDPSTRRAVINIWRENPPATRDYPCTLSCQFLIRDGLLHTMVTMRSSDLWLGVPYDLFSFSMLGAYVVAELRGSGVGLGAIHQTAGSRHLYLADLDGARACLEDESAGEEWFKIEGRGTTFSRGDDLVAWLWELAGK